MARKRRKSAPAALARGLLASHERELLVAYDGALRRRLEELGRSPTNVTWAALEYEYGLATLDFARFALADDVGLVDGDQWLFERTELLLRRLDTAAESSSQGFGSAEGYRAALVSGHAVSLFSSIV